MEWLFALIGIALAIVFVGTPLLMLESWASSRRRDAMFKPLIRANTNKRELDRMNSFLGH